MRIASKFALPVGVAQHHCFRTAGRIVLFTECPADHRLYAQDRKDAIRNVDCINLLRLTYSGDGGGIAIPDAGFFERAILFAISEVSGGGRVQLFETKARCDMPHAHYAVRLGIRKRLEQHSVNHTENGAVRADANRQR